MTKVPELLSPAFQGRLGDKAAMTLVPVQCSWAFLEVAVHFQGIGFFTLSRGRGTNIQPM